MKEEITGAPISSSFMQRIIQHGYLFEIKYLLNGGREWNTWMNKVIIVCT